MPSAVVHRHRFHLSVVDSSGYADFGPGFEADLRSRRRGSQGRGGCRGGGGRGGGGRRGPVSAGGRTWGGRGRGKAGTEGSRGGLGRRTRSQVGREAEDFLDWVLGAG